MHFIGQTPTIFQWQAVYCSLQAGGEMPMKTTDAKILFMTHVGDPGGAEFKMIALCKALRGSVRVLLLQHGSLEEILSEQQIPYVVQPLGGMASRVRKAGGLSSLLGAMPASLAMIRHLARSARSSTSSCVSRKRLSCSPRWQNLSCAARSCGS